MAWGARSGLKFASSGRAIDPLLWLNGLGSPFGIEMAASISYATGNNWAKWPGEPVRD